VSESVLDWIDGAALSAAELHQAAAWLRALDRDYYGLFDVAGERVDTLLVGLIRDPLSEFGAGSFVRLDGVLIGFVMAFAGAQMFARRMQVLKALSKAAPDPAAARARLRGFDGAGRALPPGAWYLAKLYVAEPLRGAGLGGRLLAHFMEQGRAQGCRLCLHVRRDNAAALALYRRHGFAVADDPALSSPAYCLMEQD